MSKSIEYFRKEMLELRAKKAARTNVPKCHSLKITQKNFVDVAGGGKNCEVRKNDRDYVERDYLILHEMCNDKPTGRHVIATISHIETFMQQDGYVVLSIEDIRQ